jgi:hypothetical protein
MSAKAKALFSHYEEITDQVVVLRQMRALQATCTLGHEQIDDIF